VSPPRPRVDRPLDAKSMSKNQEIDEPRGEARMKSLVRGRSFWVGLVAGVVGLAIAVGGASAARSAAKAKSICVGSGPGCFSTIQAAVSAAQDGDTITVAPGTYAGGFTIDVSVKIVGAGAGKTIISGGGPVLTIGQAFAASEPTVSISGVTITGGATHSAFVGNGFIAVGGGISVPPAANFGQGATVSIANSVITGNTVAPTTAIDSGLPCPPDITITCINGDLPFAQAAGGGINTFGAMTLTNTTVSGNQAGGPLASDVGPAGIFSFQGGLTLKNSAVTGNQAIASAPNGRFADAGGVTVVFGTLTVDGSLISDNSASIATAMPNDIPGGIAAHAGGIEISGNGSCAGPDSGCAVATIRNSTISGNTVSATNSLGDAVDFCGGICDDGQLVLSDSLVSSNHVSATVPAASTACACADSAGIGSGGIETISDTHITGNTVTAAAPAGNAIATNGGGSAGNGLSISISDSLISGNHLTATTTTGTATVTGAGFGNGAVLELRGTTVSDNTGTASGPTGTAEGGGISNVVGPGAPPGQLTLIDSAILDNTLSGDPGITIQGGGLFTTVPVTLKDSTISGNVPDQCFGC
jgi:hypothetical protein